MPSALQYVILGHDADEQGNRQRHLLMFNGAVPSHSPSYYVNLVDLEPMTDANGQASPALVLVEHDAERMLLAVIQPAKDRPGEFTDHYVLVPTNALAESALQFERWLAFLPEVSRDINVTLPLLQPPDFTAVEIEARTRHLGRFLDKLLDNDFEIALTLLGAMLHERQLVVANFPPDFQLRLGLISSFQALVPGGLAARLTFASHAPRASDRLPQLTFGDGTGDTEAWVFDWQDPQPMAEVLEHPYLDVLRLLWRGDVPALAAEIQELAALSEAADINGELGQSLGKLAERFWVDRDALNDDDVPTAVILQILEGDAPLTDEARYRYIRKLLHNALNNRDAEAGRRVAEELERNAALEDALSAEFDEMLEDQPDAVYVFIRNRLSQLGVDERWIPRLQTAARNSLEVAIQDGDVGTLAGWLELIAHEPQSYQLGGILRESILFASKRAYNDGELGIHLILIAARRVPDIVDALYADEQLIAALEPKVRAALQSATAEALEPLIGAKAEYFLLALIHGVKAADGQLVTAASARHLWSLYESEQSVELPAIYRAPAVIRLLVTEASHQMTEDAIDILFNGIVAGDDRELTLDTAQHLADRDQLFPRLSRALLVDSLTLEKVQSVIIAVSNMKSASPPAVIDTFFSLLDSYQWDSEAQRMMEALARTMAKHQEVQVSYRHLWKLFDSCHELQVEGAARVAATQLLLQYGEEEDATAIANGVARICHNIGWSSNLKSTVNNWWRDYTRQCSLMQLQRLERELEQQRHLETQKQILKTALAMRRWLHNRNPIDFTAAINTAFTIVEHINDAFDTGQVSELDAHTIRREVEEVGAALSSEERHILANNLRNLANRITQMAENRSKPSLIRSDDSIDRQLMHGEAIPHGSIDMMKWVAGYLDGSHPQSDD